MYAAFLPRELAASVSCPNGSDATLVPNASPPSGRLKTNVGHGIARGAGVNKSTTPACYAIGQLLGSRNLRFTILVEVTDRNQSSESAPAIRRLLVPQRASEIVDAGHAGTVVDRNGPITYR